MDRAGMEREMTAVGFAAVISFSVIGCLHGTNLYSHGYQGDKELFRKLLRSYIVCSDMPHTQQVEHDDKKHGVTDQFSGIHCEVGIVGAHAHAHQGVGQEIVTALCSDNKTCKSAKERHADRDGEASDDERQKTLYRAYGHAANDTAGKPFRQFCGNRFCKADIQAA